MANRNAFFIDPTEPVLLVMVPHQRPVSAHTFCNRTELLSYCTEEAAASGGRFERWCSEEDRSEEDPEAARDWLTHDLHCYHVFECESTAAKQAQADRVERGRAHGYLGTLAALAEWGKE